MHHGPSSTRISSRGDHNEPSTYHTYNILSELYYLMAIAPRQKSFAMGSAEDEKPGRNLLEAQPRTRGVPQSAGCPVARYGRDEGPAARPCSWSAAYVVLPREAEIGAPFLSMPCQARYAHVPEAVAAGKRVMATPPLSTEVSSGPGVCFARRARRPSPAATTRLLCGQEHCAQRYA
mgnify:CR=1 FL=1|jgi:hypothetical protein